jgi:hypothetical protein
MAFLLVGCTTLPAGPEGAATGLDGVWSATLVYLPDRPNAPIRVHAPEFAAGPVGQGNQPLPAVIFLHGCSGYREGASQAAYPLRNRQSRSIVLKNFGHEVSEHPDTIPTLVKFFQANIRP